MSDVYSSSIGVGINSSGQGISIDDNRRMFNFGERIAELNPAASPFFAYLSKVAKKPTDDPVFKFLEKRHQWQRRNFKVTSAVSAKTWSSSDASLNIVDGDQLFLSVDYDVYGRKVAGSTKKPEFLTVGQTIALQGLFKANGSGSGDAVIVYYRIDSLADADATKKDVKTASFIKALYIPTETDSDNDPELSGAVTIDANDTLQFAADAEGQVIGSAHAEGGTAPDGWRDEFYSREGYCQIFKTAVPLFSGTSLATRYRGDANEYMRVYQEKLMEHKMDIENALLFGYGSVDETSTSQSRKTWGILPYAEIYGKTKTFSYASSGYDEFVDAMSDLFDPESGAGGQKMVMASRGIMNWLNKLGSTSFLGNTMAYANNPYKVGIEKGNQLFNGVPVTTVDTLYGTLNFVMQPLFRGPWANHAVVVDLNNVAYRPLAGNGESRDTQIITNVQNNDVDGRKDMILTEAGLEVQLPETHAVMKFA